MARVEMLFDGVFLLHGEVGGRPLQLPLLVGANRSVLMDTGCASHVEGLIIPGFREIGFDPERLSFIINTHCDVDHQGGNAGMKRIAPHALLCCGDADRDQIDTPDSIFQKRYNAYAADHDVAYDATGREWIIKELGDPCPVDLTFRGGERVRLADDWELELLHVPGHSHGHLALLDRKHDAVFGGDAIHGSVYLDLQGKPALCPTYLYIEEYLHTIDKIEAMRPGLYSGCHWPVKRGSDVIAFCQESRAFVENAERRILDAIAASPSGKTLKELCNEVGPQLGNWPEHINAELCYAFAGHLDHLVAVGHIICQPGKPVRYAAKRNS